MSSLSDRLLDSLAGLFNQERPAVKRQPPRQSPVTQRSITLSGQEIPYLLKRSSRRTIGLKIDTNGLTITAPNRATLVSIEDAISAKQDWILKSLKTFQEKQLNRPAPVVWQDGTVFPYLGTDCHIRLVKTLSTRPRFTFDNGWLTIETSKADSDSIARYVQQWLKKQAADQADTMQLTYTKVALSQATGRWGSCSSQKHIRLNWRLIMLDWSLMDYVIIHELAHLQEMNHSTRFRAIVEEWYPDWKDARKKLKATGSEVFTLFSD